MKRRKPITRNQLLLFIRKACCTLPPDSRIQDAVRAACQAMYQAKKAGRSQYVFQKIQAKHWSLNIIITKTLKDYPMHKFESLPVTATQLIDEPIDPDFSVPDSGAVIPDDLDPDFSVMPNPTPIRPDFFPPFVPTPGIPCLFCNNNQWIRGGIRFLNAAANYNGLTVYIDNRLANSGLNFAEITRYQQISQGFHTITVAGANGYTYIRKSMFIGDGMTTIAIVNSASGLDLTSIADTTCPMSYANACFRVSNLAYFSGPVNVTLGNIYFNSINVNQTASFSSVAAGGYPLTVSRSARPEIPLITTSINLSPRRIYTLYILNWSQSPDTIRTLLVEDRRN